MSDVIRKLVRPARARDSGNTILQKDFQGGVLVLTGANSAAGLRSMPVRYLFLDEVDAYPDVDGEGDPVALAEARTRRLNLLRTQNWARHTWKLAKRRTGKGFMNGARVTKSAMFRRVECLSPLARMCKKTGSRFRFGLGSAIRKAG